jgi:hypothetical protein
MLSTRKNQVYIAVVPAVLLIIAIAVYFLGGASRPGQGSLSVSPAEMHSRETISANWLALHQGVRIPVSGAVSASLAQPGMSQRAIDAYAARLRGVDGPLTGMSQAALAAYRDRLNGLASQQLGMPQRAVEAYAARWTAMAKYYQSMARR